MPPTWSFITVTYNSAKALGRFWKGERPSNVEWIVVDNASTDDSIAIAEELGARVVPLDANLGFSTANNLGLGIAEGRYIAFVNPDVTVDWITLPALQRTIDRTGGLVAPQLLNSDGSLQPNGRGAPLFIHKVLNRLINKPLYNGYQILARGDERRSAFWLIGAVIMGSDVVLRSLGGWNEKFFLYYEDKDICIRAWQHNLTVTLDGGVRWTHGWARETSGFRLKPWIHEFKAMATFYGLYPEFFLGGPLVRRRHMRAAFASGRLISPSN